jgi:hypothetical protein
VVPQEVRDAVAAKRHQDEAQTAALVSRVTPAPVRTGRDGGMHPTFLALLKPQEIREPDGTVRYVVDENAAKRLGSYVNPPLETEPVSTAIATPAPRAAPPKATPPAPATYAVASAGARDVPPPAPRQQQSGSMFASLFSSNESAPPPPPQNDSMFGRMKSFFVGDDNERKPAAAPRAPAKQATPAPKSKPQTKSEPVQAAAAPAAAPPAPAPAAANAGLLNGAQPTMPSGSFDQRFGAIR